MADFTFTSPEGKKYTVSGPQGATKDQAFGILQQQLKISQPAGGAASGKIPSPEPMGAGEQFMTGLGNPLVGARQLYSHIAEQPEQTKKVDEAVKQRQAEIQRRGGLGLAGTAGEMVGTLPAMAAGPAGALAGGAIGGALAGAAQPVTDNDYWSQKTNDTLLGGVFGLGTGGAIRTLGALIGPNLRPAARALMDSGVQLTPGQMAGGMARRVEEAFKSLPIFGSFVRGAEGRGIEGFNRAVLNQSLEPIGAQLAPGVPAGRQAVGAAKQALNQAYDHLLPQLQVRMDRDLADDLMDIRFRATELPENLQTQFNTILTQRLAPFLQRSPIPARQGTTLKQVESTLRDFADNYRGSGDPGQRQMARLFDDTRRELRRAMIRQNPQHARALESIDAAYAMFVRAETASTRRATSEGIFTPADLLSAIRSQDKTVRRGRFSQGDALLQVYAQYGQNVLPGRMPDSGTTERYLWDSAGLAAGFMKPEVPGALIGASLPYTRPGMTAINALASPGPARAAIGAGVRGAAPYAGIAGSTAEQRKWNEEDLQRAYGGTQ